MHHQSLQLLQSKLDPDFLSSTCFYALGLIARTQLGRTTLGELGWDTVGRPGIAIPSRGADSPMFRVHPWVTAPPYSTTLDTSEPLPYQSSDSHEELLLEQIVNLSCSLRFRRAKENLEW